MELHELIAEVDQTLVAEWDSRTAWGKLWYPVWLFEAALSFAATLLVVGIIVLFAWLADLLTGGYSDEDSDERTILPDIYK